MTLIAGLLCTIRRVTETTRTCRIEGCDGDASASPKFGRYAGLCSEHHEAERQRQAAQQSGSSGSTGAGAGFEAKARTLVAVGKKVDRALGRYRPAKADAEAALAEWKAQLRKLAGEDAASAS